MCALRQARILSSETDNTIKQEQNTNVNIKITPPNKQRSQTVPLYPSVQPLNPNVNFTQANQPMDIPTGLAQRDTSAVGQTLYSPTTTEDSNYPSVHPTNKGFQDRAIADLTNEIDELDKKNKFLEMLVAMYESNPLKINSYVVCESKLLMNMIKLLTDCDKVDLVLDDDITCGGCTAHSDKLIYISKILVSKDGQTEEFKYKYNRIYTEFLKYGISLKMVY
ncbi:hypothetical protein M9Y10_015838 [Tritrichomonas musculus]|uniref:Uncharacterized protein n=1 Tax=Tritrichomonas musculus TaxID=1915356 RepID=A0ABR2I624_9EUKA